MSVSLITTQLSREFCKRETFTPIERNLQKERNLHFTPNPPPPSLLYLLGRHSVFVCPLRRITDRVGERKRGKGEGGTEKDGGDKERKTRMRAGKSVTHTHTHTNTHKHTHTHTLRPLTNSRRSIHPKPYTLHPTPRETAARGAASPCRCRLPRHNTTSKPVA